MLRRRGVPKSSPAGGIELGKSVLWCFNGIYALDNGRLSIFKGDYMGQKTWNDNNDDSNNDNNASDNSSNSSNNDNDNDNGD